MDALRGDREFVLSAVRQNGHALKYATDSLRADGEIVQAAVQQYAGAVQFAADDLLEEPSFATEAKKVRRLLRLTMLSGRSTVVAAHPFYNVESVL
eukprot:6487410-Amphidinium_carterae.1